MSASGGRCLLMCWTHAQVGLAKGYRMFTMPELGAGKDPLESLYAVTGGPTAEVLAMVKDDVAPEPEPPAAAPAWPNCPSKSLLPPTPARPAVAPAAARPRRSPRAPPVDGAPRDRRARDRGVLPRRRRPTHK